MEGIMYVRTSFTPIRMISGQKDPVALGVQVTNRSDAKKSYTVIVKAPMAFGFDRSGLLREHRARIKNVDMGKGKEAVFSVYGKFNLQKGFYAFDVTVLEHKDERFDKPMATEQSKANLRVE